MLWLRRYPDFGALFKILHIPEPFPMRFVGLRASRALADGSVLEHVVDGGEEGSSDGADDLLLAAPGADAVRALHGWQ